MRLQLRVSRVGHIDSRGAPSKLHWQARLVSHLSREIGDYRVQNCQITNRSVDSEPGMMKLGATAAVTDREATENRYGKAPAGMQRLLGMSLSGSGQTQEVPPGASLPRQGPMSAPASFLTYGATKRRHIPCSMLCYATGAFACRKWCSSFALFSPMVAASSPRSADQTACSAELARRSGASWRRHGAWVHGRMGPQTRPSGALPPVHRSSRTGRAGTCACVRARACVHDQRSSAECGARSTRESDASPSSRSVAHRFATCRQFCVVTPRRGRSAVRARR